MPHLSPLPWSNWLMLVWMILLMVKVPQFTNFTNSIPKINNFYIANTKNIMTYWKW